MAKRGRPKGSLNKKTLEKLEQSSNGVKEADIVVNVDADGSKVKPLGETQEKVLKGPETGKRKRMVSDLPRNPSVVEILKLVEETTGKQAKVDILKQFVGRNDVKYAMKAAFDERVQFTLPEGLPANTVVGDPDTPEGAMDMAPERFIRVFKRMQYWVVGGRAQASQSKREEIYLNTLRSLEKSEAE